MSYAKDILSGLAALSLAEFAFVWPFLRGTEATSLAALVSLLLQSLLSLKFWVIAILLFAVFFAASRGNTALRVTFFWIPTLAVSTVGVAVVALYAYLFTVVRHH
jgi:hypothetical protein